MEQQLLTSKALYLNQYYLMEEKIQKTKEFPSILIKKQKC